MSEPGPTIVSAPHPTAPESGENTLPSLPPCPARLITGSFDDPAIYQSFVRCLFDSLAPRIPAANSEVSTEIAIFARLLNLMPPAAVQQNREFFEFAFELLQEDPPNLVVVRSIRRNLLEVNDRYMGGVSRILIFVGGKTLLNAVLSALATIFVMSFACMLLMSVGVKLMVSIAGGVSSDMRLLGVVKGPSFNEALLMAHAAFLGSIVSIMSRIKSFLADQSLTPSMMYLSVVTRPIVSVLVAILAFCCLKSGLVSFHGVELGGPGGYYIAWAIGFLCGFSERLAQNFVSAASLRVSDAPATSPSQKTT